MNHCVHYWIIGPTNEGKCILCRKKRQFPTIEEIDKLFSNQMEIRKMRRARKRERDLASKNREAIPQS